MPEEIRVGKYIEVRLDADSEEAAAKSVERMCRDLLANHVIEDYEIQVPDSAANGVPSGA